ncbi:MAG: FGGY-family carbohydrate kinase [Armatimonadota bacterium]
MFLGLDVGTQSARALVASPSGEVLAQGAEPLRPGETELPAGWAEQDAEEWWRAAAAALAEALVGLRQAGHAPADLTALAVDSTSGTIVPVDRQSRPLRPALMYNDNRAVAEAQEVNAAGAELCERLGYRFGPAFALPKLLWLARHEPETLAAAHRVLHAADFLVARLTGRDDLTDTSNALKTGCDLVSRQWPAFMTRSLDIPAELLPELTSPGEPIGEVAASAAAETGLPEGLTVVAGCTDGTAAFIASGAAQPGDVNSNLGTTLVVRSVARDLVRDPLGRIYCHAHPDGLWLPGGASNVGGEILAEEFPQADYADLDRRAAQLVPTELLSYPLARTGERLPFVSATAEGFLVGSPTSQAERYAAHLEGVAFVEKWTYEVLAGLGAEPAASILVTGGGARSDLWLRIRASVLGQALHRPARAESAFGAAVLAASRTHYGSLLEACREMVATEHTVEPVGEWAEPYADSYLALRAECERRGYG